MLRRNLRRNKRASLLDALFIGIILLVFAVAMLIGFKIMTEFNNRISDIPGMTAEAGNASQKFTDHYTGVVDNSFLYLTIGLALVTIMTAALVKIHPVFIPIFIIGLVAVIFFAGIFSNLYQEIASNPELINEADQLTFSSTVLNYLPLFVGVIGILIMIVMYKVRSYDIT